jgi:hypothetical protein
MISAATPKGAPRRLSKPFFPDKRLPRRGLKNLMVLLRLHSCRMKHPGEALMRGALVNIQKFCDFHQADVNTRSWIFLQSIFSKNCHD